MSRLDRRSFLKNTTAAGVGLSIGAPWIARAAGTPSDTVVVAVMGIRSRGAALARSFARVPNTEVAALVDVDETQFAPTLESMKELQPATPTVMRDFRRALEDPGIDALVIAAPDHWHAPAALLAMQAGKHVYLEKPCGHNPREGELLIAGQAHHNRVIQVGTQQRSSPQTQQAMRDIADGLLGRPYYAKTWYSNSRGPIGYGKVVAPPPTLDWDLWQGPAPRTEYRDNIHPYNWHWFRRWGTGEALNNGTHEVDVARWALGVEFPVRVTSSGGRYHYSDDWEFYDTQVMTFDFAEGQTIVWEGTSCNPLPQHGRGRGTAIQGTRGSMIIDRDGYIVYDLDNNEVKRVEMPKSTDGMDTTGEDVLTEYHIANFRDAIVQGADLAQPIDEGHKSVLLCQLGNIAQHTGRTLYPDTRNGRLEGDPQAMELWSRAYAPGWTPTI